MTGVELAIAAAPMIAGAAIALACLAGPIWRRREGWGGTRHA